MNKIQGIKSRIEDLAIFGGVPAFGKEMPVGRPNLGNREQLLDRINDILDRRWFSNNGVYVQEFEKKVADLLGVKHCIATCNGTVALEIAIRALELKGEVIVPSMTFIATAHALKWQEITPVFCDVEPDRFSSDPQSIEAMITPRTTGIIGVHLWGHPCDVERLTEIASRHHLKLVFDASHAFACSCKGRMIGSFGDAEVFSFHATKFLNTFEGGAVVTNDDGLAKKIRLMKNFGFGGYDRVIYIGTNGKMNEISAAMGLTGLESLEAFIGINRLNYWQYRDELRDLPGIRILKYQENEKCNYQYIVLEIDKKASKVSRDLLANILWAEKILARRYFYPGCHRMEPYRSLFPDAARTLPVTAEAVQKVLALPTGNSVSVDDVQKICQAIKFVLLHADEILDCIQTSKPPLPFSDDVTTEA